MQRFTNQSFYEIQSSHVQPWSKSRSNIGKIMPFYKTRDIQRKPHREKTANTGFYYTSTLSAPDFTPPNTISMCLQSQLFPLALQSLSQIQTFNHHLFAAIQVPFCCVARLADKILTKMAEYVRTARMHTPSDKLCTTGPGAVSALCATPVLSLLSGYDVLLVAKIRQTRQRRTCSDRGH